MLSLFIFIILNFIFGWYVIVLEKDVINVFLLVEDVFKVLIFGGIVNFSLNFAVSEEKIFNNKFKLVFLD